MRQHQENCILALQRERLKNRNVPGGEDSTGDDPLAEMTGDPESPAESVSSADFALQSTVDPSKVYAAGSVRLELGMDAEELDELLSKLEVRRIPRCQHYASENRDHATNTLGVYIAHLTTQSVLYRTSRVNRKSTRLNNE